MQGIRPTMRGVLVSSRRRGVGALFVAGATAIVIATTHGQSILGPPSAANNFIETPKGWVHPKTPWGEPDIQATLNMMQAAGVPLERCANSYRAADPPCDMNKQWWTEGEHRERLAAARGRVDQGRDLIAKGEFGRALLTGVTDPATPQRQTNLIVDPPNGLLPDLTPEAKRRALAMGRSWSLPGEDPVYEDPLDFDFWENCRSRGMPSSMMPYRYNGGFKITLDYDIFLEFTSSAAGTIQGRLIGTNLKTFRGKVAPSIDKPLREFTMTNRRMNFELPNTQPWTFAGELSADGRSLTGTLSSAQGGMPVTFRKQ